MNDKKSVLRSSFLINFAIGLLIFFAFTIGLTTKVYIGGGIELYGTFLLALLILALNSPYVKHLSILSKNQALVLILIAWVLINNAELGRGIYERLMFTLFFFLVYLFISEYNEWTGFCLNSIKVLGIVMREKGRTVLRELLLLELLNYVIQMVTILFMVQYMIRILWLSMKE